MVDIKELQAQMKDSRLSSREIARRAGLSHPTILGILKGTSNPTLATINAVTDGLRAEKEASK